MSAKDQTPANPDSTNAVGVNDENKPAATLLRGVAALTTVLTAVGISDGIIGRAASERSGLLGFAVGLSLVAGILAVNASTREQSKKHERQQLVWSNWVLFVGLVLGVLAAMLVWSATRTPTVTAVEGGGPGARWIDVSVTSSGLDSREQVQLLLEPLRPARRQGERPLVPVGQPLFVAALGSDDDGKVSFKTRVPIPPNGPGYYGARAYTGAQPKGCYAHPEKHNGCVSLYVRADREPLQLSGTWSKSLALTLRLRSRSSSGPVELVLFARREHQKEWRSVAEWHLAPDSRARFRHTLRVPRVRAYADVCAVAYADGRTERACPPEPGQPGVVWLRYRVPRPSRRPAST